MTPAPPLRTYLYETAGVTLRVEYVVDSDNCLEFRNVRVLDTNYRAVGPDLTMFLHNMLLLVSDAPPECERFLSKLVGLIAEDERN